MTLVKEVGKPQFCFNHYRRLKKASKLSMSSTCVLDVIIFCQILSPISFGFVIIHVGRVVVILVVIIRLGRVGAWSGSKFL